MNARLLLLPAAIALATLLSGCQTRYDAYGRQIYGWQFGQDLQRDVDYSNPRLPLLPKMRPSTELWPVPSPYEFNDLSRYSFLVEPAPITTSIARVGDNPGCAACSDSTVRLALLASRADARDGRRASAAR